MTQQMPDLDRLTRTAQRIVLWLGPSGGQAVARRNAWTSLAADKRRRVERVEAERAAALALGHSAREMAAV